MYEVIYIIQKNHKILVIYKGQVEEMKFKKGKFVLTAMFDLNFRDKIETIHSMQWSFSEEQNLQHATSHQIFLCLQ